MQEETVKRPFLIHIPKTGGSSLRSVIPFDHPRARLGDLDTHHLPITHPAMREVVDNGDCLTFAIIRNPLERAVSLYHWLREGHGVPNPMEGVARYARNATDVTDFWTSVPVTCMFAFPHFWQQSTFIEGGRVDRVFPFEMLPAAWAEVKHECGLPDDLHLPALNVTAHSGVAELRQPAIDFLLEFYRRDIRLHNLLLE